MKRQLAVLLAIGMVPLAALQAAETVNTTFQVTAQVGAVCSVSVATLDFGAYNNVTGTNSSTQVLVTCSPNVGYDISLNKGTTPGATIDQRALRLGETTTTLDYNLYRDSNRTQVWGETIADNVVHGTGNGAVQAHDVYGAILAGPLKPPGNYSDTITATITY